MSHAREQDERAAQRIESELVASVDELEKRVHRWRDVRAQVQRIQTPVAIAAGVSAAFGLSWAIYRFGTRHERYRREARKAFLRARRHPERVATGTQKQAFPVELGRRIATSAAGVFATRAARRMARRMIPA